MSAQMYKKNEVYIVSPIIIYHQFVMAKTSVYNKTT
jgi:hypothetical protein